MRRGRVVESCRTGKDNLARGMVLIVVGVDKSENGCGC